LVEISGSNGADYTFLLKGHEDLRQDERVMQLFGLVNTLLMQDPDTFRRNLTIQVPEHQCSAKPTNYGHGN
jgi:FKBP12-rapamycin complex-associated protein